MNLISLACESEKRVFFIDNASEGIELWIEDGILKSKIEDVSGGNILQEINYLNCLAKSMKLFRDELNIAQNEGRLPNIELDKIILPIHIVF